MHWKKTPCARYCSVAIGIMATLTFEIFKDTRAQGRDIRSLLPLLSLVVSLWLATKHLSSEDPL